MPLSKNTRSTLLSLVFLAPNLLGFLCLTFLPLIIALAMAFTNWDLTLHNIFKTEPIRFVGIDNFIALFSDRYFWQYFGNTLFLMIGIPFGIAGSLGLAMLLNKDYRGGSWKIYTSLIMAAVVATGTVLMLAIGMETTAMVTLFVTLAGVLLIGGAAGGSVVYRTLFYLPSFTSGAAVYVLWRKLYNPNSGPINAALQGPLASLADTVCATPVWAVNVIAWVFLAMAMLVQYATLERFQRFWKDGDLALRSVVVPLFFTLLPAWLGFLWLKGSSGILLLVAVPIAVGAVFFRMRSGKDFSCPSPSEGFGTAIMLGMVSFIGQLIFIGVAILCFDLPQMASDGLEPPKWISDYYWAKPALMLMGFWGGVGSRNMLLYLAGLSNIPPELYEAADIDGARPFQRFWNITWPQLAPTTFFIVVMSVIGGLQGGFEQARVMTEGGPDGATTTLSYYIYQEGFEIGQLGFASATAWALFIFMFSVTVFNWKFGNRYTND